MTDIPTIPRHLLAKHFAGDERMIAAFEDLNAGAQETQEGAVANVAATIALQDATVIVLSANEAFANERILRLDPGLEADVDDTYVTIRLKDVARSQDNNVTLQANAESLVAVPADGTLVAVEHASLAGTASYVDDVAAAAGGVEIDQLYRNGSAVFVRVT